MVNDGAVSLLNDFYQLTGNPVLLPKFGFYQGHLNAYNRDYWVEDERYPFEDGKRYKESQKDNGGVKESLNGEKEQLPVLRPCRDRPLQEPRYAVRLVIAKRRLRCRIRTDQKHWTEISRT